MTRNLNEIVNCTFMNSASVIGVHSFFIYAWGYNFIKEIIIEEDITKCLMFIRFCTVYFPYQL
jgi:hypothetical protein